MLAPDTIPLSCKEVVSRVEPEGVLLFQVRTDEMFFVSQGAFSLFLLCRGDSRVVGPLSTGTCYPGGARAG